MWRGLVVLALLAGGGAAPAPSAADTQVVEAALTQWIGTAKDGWMPLGFAALRSAMSPAEVGQHFPGAEKPIGNIASKVRISGIPYVQEVQFNFLKSRPDGQRGLAHVTLTFERGFLDDKLRYEALVRVLEAKFGPMRPGPTPFTKGFWMVRTQGRQRTAQFTDYGRGHDSQLSFDVPAGDATPVTAPAASRVASTSIFHSSSCRAVEATEDKAIVEAVAANPSECNTALEQKLKAARCTSGVESVTYRLQSWAVGRWSRGVRLSLSCR